MTCKPKIRAPEIATDLNNFGQRHMNLKQTQLKQGVVSRIGHPVFFVEIKMSEDSLLRNFRKVSRVQGQIFFWRFENSVKLADIHEHHKFIYVQCTCKKSLFMQNLIMAQTMLPCWRDTSTIWKLQKYDVTKIVASLHTILVKFKNFTKRKFDGTKFFRSPPHKKAMFYFSSELPLL